MDELTDKQRAIIKAAVLNHLRLDPTMNLHDIQRLISAITPREWMNSPGLLQGVVKVVDLTYNDFKEEVQ